VFSTDAREGTLTLVEITPTQNKTPRNFGIDPAGAFLLAAHQDTHNVVVFRVDAKTGRVTPAGQILEVGSPVCVKFLPSASCRGRTHGQQAWEDFLPENGVGVDEKLTWELRGQSLYCRDSDGHLIELATPGGPGRAERAEKAHHFVSIATNPPPDRKSTESVSLEETVRCSTFRAAGSLVSRSSVAR
jgi:catechol 2,3-dioxygenase-like lactoylglutathione lyase family enzyme